MRIIAAYTPSEEARAVLEAAVDEARVHGAALTIARHVTGDVEAVTPLGGFENSTRPAVDKGSGQLVQKLREELEALCVEVRGEGVDCEAILLESGEDHAAAILGLARDSGADLIVVGVRERSAVGKAILGSEAQKILLRAECPVLAVKAGS